MIHGASDPLVHPAGGVTRMRIANSEFVRIEGMGHDLPVGVWPTIVDAVSNLTERA